MRLLTVLSVMSVFALSHSLNSYEDYMAFKMIEPYINAKVSDSPNFLKVIEASYRYLIKSWAGEKFHFEFNTYLRETDCKKPVSDTSKCSYKDSGKRYNCTSQVTRNYNKPWTVTAKCEKPVQEQGTFTELINAPTTSRSEVLQQSHFWMDHTNDEMRAVRKDIREEIAKRPSVYREVFVTKEVKKQVINEGKSVTYKLKISLMDTDCKKAPKYTRVCITAKDTAKDCDVVFRPPIGAVTKMLSIKCDSSPLG